MSTAKSTKAKSTKPKAAKKIEAKKVEATKVDVSTIKTPREFMLALRGKPAAERNTMRRTYAAQVKAARIERSRA